MSKVQGYTARWAAPEVLWSDGKITREADIFAFGMVMVEVSPCISLYLKLDVERQIIYLALKPYLRSLQERVRLARSRPKSLFRRLWMANDQIARKNRV